MISPVNTQTYRELASQQAGAGGKFNQPVIQYGKHSINTRDRGKGVMSFDGYSSRKINNKSSFNQQK